MVTEISTCQQVHDQVQVLAILERVVHIDDERVLELRQDLSLVHHRLNAALVKDAGFGHLFHGIYSLYFLAFNLPYLSESAFADAEVVHKRVLGESCHKLGLSNLPVMFSPSNSV